MSDDLEIAMEALKHYAIQVDSVDLIGQSANFVFKVADIKQNRYSLRFHKSKSETLETIWTHPEVINSEMVWLQALAKETVLTVPTPYKNRMGEFVTDVRGVKCTLIGWVEGEQKPFIPTADDAGRVGQMIGELHKQASSWIPPEHFSRPAFDGSRILQSLNKIKGLSESGGLDKEIAEMLIMAGQRSINMMHTIEKTPNNWGIIHADLIPSNFVFYDQQSRPIDFGACGFGYYLFDLGWTFSYIHPAFRNKLLEAYSASFKLPDNHVELLEGFFVAAQLETMNFWLGLPDALEWLPGHMDKLAGREFKHYVNQESFLFTGTPYWE
ncbi:phosphotransferase enzyme family protein [Paenibacillus sp. NEAU-GSW1]|uniref:phosphotransferase enzyme family protein n=1 Tax=Paenibacillus sp. NEAU-GSW1 TaxID=2682486 RepID=UPI0012E26FC5|nr:phosphotransferase [Paenibacillus sp. NEAU-GSW1]MUT68828.1 phosphotransferase [Paenibacillus sp. NEAU-GSW1]